MDTAESYVFICPHCHKITFEGKGEIKCPHCDWIVKSTRISAQKFKEISEQEKKIRFDPSKNGEDEKENTAIIHQKSTRVPVRSYTGDPNMKWRSYLK